MKFSEIAFRMRVEAGEPGTEDHDAGMVVDTNEMSATGHEVMVAWGSGVMTWCEAARLRPEGEELEVNGRTFADWLEGAGRTDTTSSYDLRAAWRRGEDPGTYTAGLGDEDES